MNKSIKKPGIVLDFNTRNFNAPSLAKAVLEHGLESELVDIALGKDQLVGNRAIWVLTHCADFEPERIKPFHRRLVDHLKGAKIHSGIIRSILHIFQSQPVPKSKQTFMLDKCFEYMKNPTQAIAVRAFAMTVAFNISRNFPELLKELQIVLSTLGESEESAGIKSRSKKVIGDIQKIIPARDFY